MRDMEFIVAVIDVGDRFGNVTRDTPFGFPAPTFDSDGGGIIFAHSSFCAVVAPTTTVTEAVLVTVVDDADETLVIVGDAAAAADCWFATASLRRG